MSHACSEGTKEEELIEQCVQMFGQIKQIGIMNLQHTVNSQIDLWYKKQLQSVNVSFIHGFISLIRNLITEGNQRLNWICVRLTVI